MNDLEEINNLHERAMDLAEKADFARREGDLDAHRRMLAEALDLEWQAARSVSVDQGMEPTRSVLHQSAASIAVELGDKERAYAILSRGLDGSPPVELRREMDNELASIVKSMAIKVGAIRSHRSTRANRTAEKIKAMINRGLQRGDNRILMRLNPLVREYLHSSARDPRIDRFTILSEGPIPRVSIRFTEGAANSGPELRAKRQGQRKSDPKKPV